jgi:hypothetical protein
LTRRRTREQDNDDDDMTKLEEELDDDMAEEDEVTRCVCGYQEYPGMPSDAVKSGSVPTDPDVQADDLGGLFIQCDICKVWQHGGCVGIMQEEASPDEYFCEECRKDLHKVMTSPKGYVFPSSTISRSIATLLLGAPIGHYPIMGNASVYTQQNASRISRETMLTLPCTAKSTRDTSRYLTSNRAKHASHPSPKTAKSNRAETKIAIQEQASTRLANVGTQ